MLLAIAFVAPDGTPTGRTIEVAFVQGGGPQGTRASNTRARDVVERHLAATRTLAPGPDLVVWPENVIDVARFETSVERDEVAAEAERLGVPIIVGITEEAVGRDAFVNTQVVVLPDGTISSRYEKVRRVPFGEYMPMRGLLKSLGAPVDQVPRDAVAGTGPAYLDTPEGRVARGHLVGGVLRRPRPRRRREGRTVPHQPDERFELHRHRLAESTSRVVAAARHRDGTVVGAGVTDRLQRLRDARR